MTKQKNDTPQLYYFYKLVCNNHNIKDLYVGCTVNWNDRKTMHKSSVNNKTTPGYNSKKAQIIRANGGWVNWSMLEIERGIYIRRMAEAHEYELMVKLNSTMNHQRCFNSHSKCKHDIIKQNCKDCVNFIKHLENNKHYHELGKCKRNGYFLPNSGEQYYFYANSCRMNEIYCGPEGKFFIKK